MSKILIPFIYIIYKIKKICYYCISINFSKWYIKVIIVNTQLLIFSYNVNISDLKFNTFMIKNENMRTYLSHKIIFELYLMKIVPLFLYSCFPFLSIAYAFASLIRHWLVLLAHGILPFAFPLPFFPHFLFFLMKQYRSLYISFHLHIFFKPRSILLSNNTKNSRKYSVENN